MTTWFTTAQGDDIDDTLERVAHWALTEFYERHLSVLGDTAIALIPVQNGNAVWCKRVATIGDPEFPTHHAGWALARELPASGGHGNGRSPTPPLGGVRWSGEGQEPRCQGHPEG
jgi:hypothetical protein